MVGVAYANGRFRPIEEAMVNIEDRGYQFGDGVYEAVRTYEHQLFLLDEHIDRLWLSASAIDIECPLSKERLRDLAIEAVGRIPEPNLLCYMQLTRGVAPRQHHYPAEAEPAFVMTVRSFADPANQLRAGVKVITYPETRWKMCHIKSLNLLPNVMAKEKAIKSGAREAVFVEEDGTVTEGSATNVFIVRDGKILTHPLNGRILKGVTRTLVLELAAKAGFETEERKFSLAELTGADEVFLTGTTMEITPVNQVDNEPIGTGRPGPVSSRLLESYREYVTSGSGF